MEVTEKHKDMAGGEAVGTTKKMRRYGRRERSGEQKGRMIQRVKKTRENLGRNGGIWHRGKVKSRGGNCEGKLQFQGAGGEEAESIPLKKTEPK